MADNDDIFGTSDSDMPTRPVTGGQKSLGDSSTAEPLKSRPTQGRPTPTSDPSSLPTGGQIGSELARSMIDSEVPYHPVVIVGNSSSGKTHLVVSLLAALNMEGDWELRSEFCTDLKGSPEQTREGKRLYYELVQKFIQGKGAAATRGVSDVFFVPVKVSSKSDGERQFAFMESAGEWYTPDRDSPEYFQPLRESIKVFLTDFDKPITFVYLLPYTQINSIGSERSADDDVQQRQIAGEAIVGVIDQYHLVRGPNRYLDNHLFMVSKWDVHQRSTDSASSLDEVLLDCVDDVEPFVEKNYLQAYTKFRNLQATSNDIRIFHYSAGRMDGQRIVPMDRDSDTSRAISELQSKVWKWLWGNASQARYGNRTSPFQEAKPGLVDRIYRWLDGWL